MRIRDDTDQAVPLREGGLVRSQPWDGILVRMKRFYYFAAGVALGVAATRRTRRAKQAAKAALAAKLTPAAIAADIADAIAEIGNAVGSFASDVRVGAANRRASYRPMIDGATGSVVMVPPEQLREITAQQNAAGAAGQAADARHAASVDEPLRRSA
jgi:hypothetical protein